MRLTNIERLPHGEIWQWWSRLTNASLNIDNVLQCYQKYMSFTTEHLPTYKEYVNNMEEKMHDDEFLGDTVGLLQPSLKFNPQQGYELIKTQLIDKLPGDRD